MNRTRIAPTPSGFLHAGNLYNFLLTERVADEVQAEMLLRIDDLDAFRMRDEYVEDVFRCLHWLDIEWNGRPRSIDDYRSLAAAPGRIDRYYERLEAMIDAGLPAFICRCSRRELSRDAICERGCETKQLKLVAGKTAIRIRVPEQRTELRAAMGDFVVWRREDLPAYQLQSLIDDVDMGITHIVRGEDLLDSTLAQQFLSEFVEGSRFSEVRFFHHGLVTGEHGQKLSKSQGTERLELTPDLLSDLRDMVADTEIEWD